jgi:hypothetical protein
MSRRLVEQFVIFYFAINDRPLIEDDEDEASYRIWKHAVKLLEERERAHPRRTFTDPDDRYEMTHTRWELCEQGAEVEVRHRLAAWPLTFYNSKAFDQETLVVLRDLCLQCMTEAASAAGGTTRFMEATTQSTYTENFTELVEGLR